MTEMMHLRVDVNESLAEDETIQVLMQNEHEYRLRPLGLINGLFGAEICGWGHIAMELDGSGGITSFKRVTHMECSEKSHMGGK